MSQREVEIRCACLIANLEGRRHFRTTGFNDPPYLEDLDRRLRFLELRNDSATATPTQAPTWETLAWRICRLDNANNPKLIPVKILSRSAFGSLLPETTDVDFDTLVRIVADLVAKVTVAPSPPPGLVGGQGQMDMMPLPKLVDDEEKLDILRQRLFFIAGKRQHRVTVVPLTKRDVYVLAADLSLDAEASIGSPGLPPFPAGGPPPLPPAWGPRPGFAKKKACCGCCSCRCHSSSNRKHVVDPFATRKESKLKKFFKFGWLKKLACWKKKKVYSSSSASSISTLEY